MVETNDLILSLSRAQWAWLVLGSTLVLGHTRIRLMWDPTRGRAELVTAGRWGGDWYVFNGRLTVRIPARTRRT